MEEHGLGPGLPALPWKVPLAEGLSVQSWWMVVDIYLLSHLCFKASKNNRKAYR